LFLSFFLSIHLSSVRSLFLSVWQEHGPCAGGWALLQEAATAAPAAVPAAQLVDVWASRDVDDAATASCMLHVLAATAPQLPRPAVAELTGAGLTFYLPLWHE
jgi:hypothetical protein